MRTEKNEVMERNETVQMMRNGTMEREKMCIRDRGFGEACRSGDRVGGHGAGGEFGSLGARQFGLSLIHI